MPKLPNKVTNNPSKENNDQTRSQKEGSSTIKKTSKLEDAMKRYGIPPNDAPIISLDFPELSTIAKSDSHVLEKEPEKYVNQEKSAQEKLTNTNKEERKTGNILGNFISSTLNKIFGKKNDQDINKNQDKKTVSKYEVDPSKNIAPDKTPSLQKQRKNRDIER